MPLGSVPISMDRNALRVFHLTTGTRYKHAVQGVVYGLFNLPDDEGVLGVVRPMPIKAGNFDLWEGTTIPELSIALSANANANPVILRNGGRIVAYVAGSDPFHENKTPSIMYDAPPLSHMQPGGIAVFRNIRHGARAFYEQTQGEPRMFHVRTELLEKLDEIPPVRDDTLLERFEARVFQHAPVPMPRA
ncbi:MAG: hypothetical protein HY362_03620 [Candidatus Aenigmarchaeota archaeon]|nr:hypothetical protein [Candidatus Aenigmarchaeota archaeon]